VKSHILKFILLLSLLLNFSLLGTAGYSYYRQTRVPPAPIGHSVQGRAPSGSATQAHIFEALDLKPDQLKVLQEKAGLFHQALDGKQARVADLRSSLLALMRADQPDRKAIEASIADINAVQQQIQELIVSHMLEFKSILDRDQQKKFLDLIQEAMNRVGEMRCP
jgi:Spy/CpxP family protein refolding chaperone